MKKSLIFLVAVLLMLTSCEPGSTPSSIPTIAPTVTSPTPIVSPTQTAPTWNDFLLIDPLQPVVLVNETQDYQRKEIYGSDVILDKLSHWIIDVQVEKLAEDIGESSTAIKLLGYSDNGTIQQLVIVYQWGKWSVAYATQPNLSENTFLYWEEFQNVTAPTQRFELTIAADRKSFSLKNGDGHNIVHFFGNETLFDGTDIVTTYAQIGPQTKITFSRFSMGQFYKEEIVNTTLSPTSPVIITNDGGQQHVYHVAVNGNDANPGTEEMPFATIEYARDIIRTMSLNMQSPINVIIHGGTYDISQPVIFTENDSGQNGYDIIYRAAEGETPIFSGGVNVTNWERVSDTPLWKATLHDVKIFRQMYINGNRAQRAASQNQVTGNRWVAGDFSDRDGIVISPANLPDLSRPQDLELHWIYDWKDMRLLVEDIVENPDGTKTVWMKQPYYEFALRMEQLGSGHYWIPKYNVPFYLENAYEFLDEPGEWYFNPDTQELFYMPVDGEDMNTANVIIPQTQNLLEITGGIVGDEVHNLVFDGLTFAYAGWTRASEIGTFGPQAQSLITRIGSEGDSYWEKKPAHIQVNSAYDIRFERCRFEHLGAVGFDLNNNVYNVTIQGNLFQDISDGAIAVGHWKHAYITSPVIQAPSHDNLISNNLITNVGVEYWGAAAISAYYVNNLHIVHNEISNISHGGITLGWGWANTLDSTTAHDNLIANNLITDFHLRARDGGGIYTLGQQPGTIIDSNVIRRMKNDYGCLYADEGSAFTVWQNNVCDTVPQWLWVPVPLIINNFTTTVHDVQVLNTYTNVQHMRNGNVEIINTVYVNGQNWPPEAQSIIDSAGLELDYSYLYEWLDK